MRGGLLIFTIQSHGVLQAQRLIGRTIICLYHSVFITVHRHTRMGHITFTCKISSQQAGLIYYLSWIHRTKWFFWVHFPEIALHFLSSWSPIWHAGGDQSLQYVMLEKPPSVLWERSYWKNANPPGKDVRAFIPVFSEELKHSGVDIAV